MADRSFINLNAYATEGQNVGTGTTVYAGKCGASTLLYKTISATGSGISISGDSENIIVSGSTGSASAWGDITGTLSNQTDLQSALDLKVDSANFTGYTATTETTLTTLQSDLDSVSAQTDTNTSDIALKLNTDDFTGYTATTDTTLTDLRSDVDTVSGQTDTNTADIITISGKTIDNLQSGILEYNVADQTFEPYSGLTSFPAIYTGTTCPTGVTRVIINGSVVATEFRASTANTNTTHLVGDIYWDNDDNTIAIQQSPDVTLQVGQESYVYVKNNTGSGINNGDVVYIDGADGDRPTIALARAASTDTSVVGAIIGVATEDIPSGATGYVTSFGLVKGLNTSGYVGGPGTPLYVSTTVSGATQETRPSPPDYAIKLGIIAKKDGIDGRVLISVTDQTDLTGITYTASNGLTKVGSNDFQLGGTLDGDTVIDGNGGNDLCIHSVGEFNVTGVSTTLCNSFGLIVESDSSFNLKRNGNVVIIATSSTKMLCDSDNAEGFVYGQDYSTVGSLNPRWIPDNAYVTGLTSGAITGADNGLTKVGSDVVIGGSLTGNTQIDTLSGYFRLCSSTSPNNLLCFASAGAEMRIGTIATCFGSICANCDTVTFKSQAGTCVSSLTLQHSDNSISFNAAGGTKISGNTTGFYYAGDYSGTGDSDPRWLPDNAYITGITSQKVDCADALSGYTSGDTVSVGTYSLPYCATLSNVSFGVCNMPTLGTTEQRNIAIGICNMQSNNDGCNNVAVGYRTLVNNDNGCDNIAIGNDVLYNITGSSNIGIGFQALYNTTEGFNIGIGRSVLCNNTGIQNIGVGFNSLGNIDSGCNVAIGVDAMQYYTGSTGGNVAIGYVAAKNSCNGHDHVAIGTFAGYRMYGTSGNVAIGLCALYSGGTNGPNIAIGQNAHKTNTTGYYNIAMGNLSLANNTTGHENIALGGVQVLTNNTSGNYNVGIGTQTLVANTVGVNNIALGFNAMTCNDTGNYNIAMGQQVLRLNETGSYNIALGNLTLQNAVGSSYNIALGRSAASTLTGGTTNIAIGRSALGGTEGDYNIAIGYLALNGSGNGSDNIGIGCGAVRCNGGSGNIGLGESVLRSITTGGGNIGMGLWNQCDNVSGSDNVALGDYSLMRNVSGSNNMGMGQFSLYWNCTGFNNVALGASSMYWNISGSTNTAVGYQALYNLCNGSDNVGLGRAAGYALSTGASYNVAVGVYALQNTTTGDCNIAIGCRALSGNVTGNTNVAIGPNAGASETGSSKLHIANSNLCSLICGDFANKTLAVDGVFFPGVYNCVDVSCSGLPAPSGVTGGMIYVADAVLMAWSDGTDWIDFATANPI